MLWDTSGCEKKNNSLEDMRKKNKDLWKPFDAGILGKYHIFRVALETLQEHCKPEDKPLFFAST